MTTTDGSSIIDHDNRIKKRQPVIVQLLWLFSVCHLKVPSVRVLLTFPSYPAASVMCGSHHLNSFVLLLFRNLFLFIRIQPNRSVYGLGIRQKVSFFFGILPFFFRLFGIIAFCILAWFLAKWDRPNMFRPFEIRPISVPQNGIFGQLWQGQTALRSIGNRFTAIWHLIKRFLVIWHSAKRFSVFGIRPVGIWSNSFRLFGIRLNGFRLFGIRLNNFHPV